MNKRIFGFLSWQIQRRSAKTDQILAAVARDLAQRSIDHVVLTGDLTHVGLPHDFAIARQFLQRLGPPARITVIPGNHDALVRGHRQAIFDHLAAYMVCDGGTSAAVVPEAAYPLVRIRSGVAVIGVCTARPSPPFLAVGTVGQPQLERLGAILQQTGAQGLLRIVLIHHPPLAGAVGRRKRLTDQTAFRRVVAKYGADLILHGHTHRSSLDRLEACNGSIPVIGAPSVTRPGNRNCQAQYHLYCLKKSPGGWKILLSGRCLSAFGDGWVSQPIGELQLPRPNP